MSDICHMPHGMAFSPHRYRLSGYGGLCYGKFVCEAEMNVAGIGRYQKEAEMETEQNVFMSKSDV